MTTAPVLVAFGQRDALATTTDGTTWTLSPGAMTGTYTETQTNENSPQDVVHDRLHSRLVFVGYHKVAAADAQGTLGGWVRYDSPARFTRVAYSPALDRFVASDEGGHMWTSSNLQTWTDRGLVFYDSASGFAITCTRILWVDELGRFVAVGASASPTTTPFVFTSPDGITWTRRTSVGTLTGTFESVVWSPALQLLVGVGFGGVVSSADGITWTKRATIGDYGVAWDPERGQFATTSGGSNFYISTNGIDWVTSNNPVSSPVWAAAFGKFYGSYLEAIYIYNNNGSSTSTSSKVLTWSTGSKWRQLYRIYRYEYALPSAGWGVLG